MVGGVLVEGFFGGVGLRRVFSTDSSSKRTRLGET